LVGIGELADRAPPRGIAVRFARDRPGIFGNAFGDFKARFCPGGSGKQLVAMAAKSERVADGLGLRRPLFDQRSGERSPFELQP
jgi:hypothetical protein